MAVLFPEPARPVTMTTSSPELMRAPRISRTSRWRTTSQPLVLFADQTKELTAIGGLYESLTKVRVLQQARHAGESLEVLPDRILRRNEHEEQTGGLAVERLEIDPGAVPTERPEYALQARELPVRNGDPVAD